MVKDVLERKLTHCATAARHHVSVPTVRNGSVAIWLKENLACATRRRGRG